MSAGGVVAEVQLDAAVWGCNLGADVWVALFYLPQPTMLPLMPPPLIVRVARDAPI